MNRFAIPIATLSTVLLVLGCSHAPRQQDRSVKAIEAHDATGLVEGCGHQPVVGYTYCRMVEGLPTQGSLVFLAPPITCKQNTCVLLKIYSPMGQTVTAHGFAKGQTRLEVPWRAIVSRDKFEVQDRGFWPFTMLLSFTDSEGQDRSLLVEGEVRLRVHKAGYTPLNHTAVDPSFTWEFIESGTVIKMTTGGRAYVAPSAGIKLNPAIPRKEGVSP